jgi:hypothetical protein
MSARSHRGLARRFGDRVVCLWRGHAWETIEVTLGESPLLSTDCARCGHVGPIHGTDHRTVTTTQLRR